MHIQTHLMSGWCVANVVELTPRERTLAMLAASLADIDGLGLLIRQDLYEEYHHVLAHNLWFALMIAATLTVFSTHRIKAFVMFLVLAHLHLILDYLGSGPGWTIPYLWPMEELLFENPHAWPLASWQNFLAGAGFLAWVMVIAVRKRRTPLENIAPRMDAQIVQRFGRRA